MDEKIVNITCSSVAVTSTLLQTEHIFQIISLILTIISSLVILCFNLYKWILKSKEDKKLSIDEINDGIKILEDSMNEIKNKINNKGNKNGNL